MSDLSVVVGYSELETFNYLSEFLETFEYNVLETTEYGFNCVEAVNEYNPDILICDAFMYDLNACEIIETVKKLGKADPAFVVVSRTNVSHLAGLSECRDISFYTLAPFDFLTFDKRLRTIVEQKQRQLPFAQPDTEPGMLLTDYPDSYKNQMIVNSIRENMRLLGIPAKIRGYRYIFDAVMLTLYDSDLLYSITKQLYPRLAKISDTTVASVERAIRVAVKRSWEKGSYEVITDMFGSTVKDGAGPTNGQFISMLTERVKNDIGIV